MPIFSEIYGTYYTIVNQILMKNNSLSKSDIHSIVQNLGFKETLFHIEKQLMITDNWDLLTYENHALTPKIPSIPPVYRDFEKRFLKTIIEDSRIALFLEQEEITKWQTYLHSIEPLFSNEDILYFDQFSDGDPYSDPSYITHFKMILKAIQKNKMVYLEYEKSKNNELKGNFNPQKLEFSQKNNRFRLYAISQKNNTSYILNMKHIRLTRILSENAHDAIIPNPQVKTICCILFDHRNALERAMFHFASYRKTTKRLDENTFELTITYKKAVESEVLIQILSFGPMLKVVSPAPFVHKIKQRLQKQKALFSQKL